MGGGRKTFPPFKRGWGGGVGGGDEKFYPVLRGGGRNTFFGFVASTRHN